MNKKDITEFEPLHDFIMAAAVQAPDKEGSIYVPDRSRRQTTEGVVIALGPNLNHERPISVGDTIVWQDHTAISFESRGKRREDGSVQTYVCVRFQDAVMIRHATNS